MYLTNPGYFDYKINSKDPQFEPHARVKMAQVLGSLVYICARGAMQTKGMRMQSI